jgi:hypothetical protein
MKPDTLVIPNSELPVRTAGQQDRPSRKGGEHDVADGARVCKERLNERRCRNLIEYPDHSIRGSSRYRRLTLEPTGCNGHNLVPLRREDSTDLPEAEHIPCAHDRVRTGRQNCWPALEFGQPQCRYLSTVTVSTAPQLLA